jgi:predicted metal-dependent phosphoesterase TrpH
MRPAATPRASKGFTGRRWSNSLNGKIDLHVHTCVSDGRLTPRQIVELAYQQGVGLLSIADHDSVDGVAPAKEAARRYPGLRVIPGVELSSHSPGNEVHILGYFVRCDSPTLQAELKSLRDSREERAKAMVQKLQAMGFDISLERVQQIAGEGSIGRPHIAQALMEKGLVSDFREVFDKYIGQGGPAYVDRHKLTPEQAIGLVLESGGIPVLAHPTTANVYQLLPGMLAAGLMGLEVYYKDYLPDTRQELANMARKHRLIATGGTDYHGIEDTEVMLGGSGVPRTVETRLFALAAKKGIDISEYCVE